MNILNFLKKIKAIMSHKMKLSNMKNKIKCKEKKCVSTLIAKCF